MYSNHIEADDIITANQMCAALALEAYRTAQADGAAAGLALLATVEHNYGRAMREAVAIVVTDIAANPTAWGMRG